MDVLKLPEYVPGTVDHRKTAEPGMVIYTGDTGWFVWQPCINCFQMVTTPVTPEYAMMIDMGVMRSSPLCRGCTN